MVTKGLTEDETDPNNIDTDGDGLTDGEGGLGQQTRTATEPLTRWTRM